MWPSPVCIWRWTAVIRFSSQHERAELLAVQACTGFSQHRLMLALCTLYKTACTLHMETKVLLNLLLIQQAVLLIRFEAKQWPQQHQCTTRIKERTQRWWRSR